MAEGRGGGGSRGPAVSLGLAKPSMLAAPLLLRCSALASPRCPRRRYTVTTLLASLFRAGARSQPLMISCCLNSLFTCFTMSNCDVLSSTFSWNVHYRAPAHSTPLASKVHSLFWTWELKSTNWSTNVHMSSLEPPAQCSNVFNWASSSMFSIVELQKSKVIGCAKICSPSIF